MSSIQHTTVAVTPDPTGLSVISQPPVKPAEIFDVQSSDSEDEDEERAALLEKLALLDKQGKEKQARKKAEAEKKIHEEQVQKAREEAEKKARVLEEYRIHRTDKQSRLEAAAAISPKMSSVLPREESNDRNRGEGPSGKRPHSSGPGSDVPQVIIYKKKKQLDPIDTDADSDSEEFMQKRGPCENCVKKHLRCFLQPRNGRNLACVPCNKAKLGCSWVRKKQIEPNSVKDVQLPVVPAESKTLRDLLGTIVGQNSSMIHQLAALVNQGNSLVVQSHAMVHHLEIMSANMIQDPPIEESQMSVMDVGVTQEDRSESVSENGKSKARAP